MKTETTVQPQKSPTPDAEVRCADCDAMIFVPITRPPSEQEKRCDYCFDVFLSKMSPA